jgi:hypothetical protein
MNAPTYIQQPVTTAELQDLVVLATQELQDFFQRNSHLDVLHAVIVLHSALVR